MEVGCPWRGMVGFLTVVAVGWFAFGLVDPDQSDVSGFEEPVEVDATECPVVGVSDQAGRVWRLGGIGRRRRVLRMVRRG